MAHMRNPILPGFNPDPSICRAGDDFYIATSTFEWYPGVQIFHSRDLVNWKLVCRPLNRAQQLDMRGDPDSCGIWAPCLSYADGQFWLIYTDVKRYDGSYKDTHNYLVTAPSIEGPWSDAIYLNSSGFDPSLFHDDDGRKWLLNMVWDHRGAASASKRPRSGFFGGILLQQYDHETQKLTGPITNIFRGTPLGLVEGPHVYKRNGWYYLITAEGGTGYNHAVTHARSRSLTGPYELHPAPYVITAKDMPENFLQRAGHGQFIELDDGSVYHTHLTSRPIPGTRFSPMGRETAIQRCVWGDDDWLYMESGGPVPHREVKAPDLPSSPVEPEPEHITFDDPELPIVFQWLRTPYKDRLFSLSERSGWLRLYGRESIGSWFEQSLVARRQTAWSYSAETALEFRPEGYLQMAGLAAYYNRTQFHYLCVTATEDGQRLLTIQSCPGRWPDATLSFPLEEDVPLPQTGKIWLGVDVDRETLQFRYATSEGQWQPVGPVLDATKLTDEGGRGEHACFTGAFIGMAAQDKTGRALHADFEFFSYRDRED